MIKKGRLGLPIFVRKKKNDKLAKEAIKKIAGYVCVCVCVYTRIYTMYIEL